MNSEMFNLANMVSIGASKDQCFSMAPAVNSMGEEGPLAKQGFITVHLITSTLIRGVSGSLPCSLHAVSLDSVTQRRGVFVKHPRADFKDTAELETTLEIRKNKFYFVCVSNARAARRLDAQKELASVVHGLISNPENTSKNKSMEGSVLSGLTLSEYFF